VIGLGKGGLSPGLLQIQERDERKNRGGENCLSYLRRKTNKGRNRGKEERKERKTEKKKKQMKTRVKVEKTNRGNRRTFSQLKKKQRGTSV
jgi:hypothetical protein